MYDYFVVGDFKICGKVSSCLIRCASKDNEERANEVLAEVIANPPKDCLGNIHIEKEKSEDCWWNGKLD